MSPVYPCNTYLHVRPKRPVSSSFVCLDDWFFVVTSSWDDTSHYWAFTFHLSRMITCLPFNNHWLPLTNATRWLLPWSTCANVTEAASSAVPSRISCIWQHISISCVNRHVNVTCSCCMSEVRVGNVSSTLGPLGFLMHMLELSTNKCFLQFVFVVWLAGQNRTSVCICIVVQESCVQRILPQLFLSVQTDAQVRE